MTAKVERETITIIAFIWQVCYSKTESNGIIKHRLLKCGKMNGGKRGKYGGFTDFKGKWET